MTKTDPHISFVAYHNYLLAVRYLLGRKYDSGDAQLAALSQTIEERPAFQRMQQRRHARRERLAGLMSIAWQTEVALNLPCLLDGEDGEFAALSTHWGTIQLYYAVYSAASAWLEAMQGESAPKDHRAVLNVLADYAATKALFPLPWGAACRCCSPVEYCGEAEGYTPKYINPLSSAGYETALDRLCLALKTTREQELERRVAEWKRERRRKRISRPEREKRDNFAPTTLFDFLWRLRVRANYVDAELFLAGGEFEQSAVSFLDCLCRIGSATLLLFEKLLAKSYGKVHIEALADQFVERSRYGRMTVGRRRPYW